MVKYKYNELELDEKDVQELLAKLDPRSMMSSIMDDLWAGLDSAEKNIIFDIYDKIKNQSNDSMSTATPYLQRTYILKGSGKNIKRIDAYEAALKLKSLYDNQIVPLAEKATYDSDKYKRLRANTAFDREKNGLGAYWKFAGVNWKDLYGQHDAALETTTTNNKGGLVTTKTKGFTDRNNWLRQQIGDYYNYLKDHNFRYGENNNNFDDDHFQTAESLVTNWEGFSPEQRLQMMKKLGATSADFNQYATGTGDWITSKPTEGGESGAGKDAEKNPLKTPEEIAAEQRSQQIQGIIDSTKTKWGSAKLPEASAGIHANGDVDWDVDLDFTKWLADDSFNREHYNTNLRRALGNMDYSLAFVSNNDWDDDRTWQSGMFTGETARLHGFKGNLGSAATYTRLYQRWKDIQDALFNKDNFIKNPTLISGSIDSNLYSHANGGMRDFLYKNGEIHIGNVIAAMKSRVSGTSGKTMYDEFNAGPVVILPVDTSDGYLPFQFINQQGEITSPDDPNAVPVIRFISKADGSVHYLNVLDFLEKYGNLNVPIIASLKDNILELVDSMVPQVAKHLEGGTLQMKWKPSSTRYTTPIQNKDNLELDRAAENGISYETQKAKDRTIFLKDEYNTEGFTSVEAAHLAATAGDLAATIMGFIPGANVAGSVVSAGATLGHLGADWADDSVTAGEMIKNFAIDAGLSLATLVPGVGSTGKLARLGKSILKLTPKLMTAWGAMGLGDAAASLKKLASDDSLTAQDWNNILNGITVVLGGTNTVHQHVKRKALDKLLLDGGKGKVGVDVIDTSGKKQTIVLDEKVKLNGKEVETRSLNKQQLDDYLSQVEGTKQFKVAEDLSAGYLGFRRKVKDDNGLYTGETEFHFNPFGKKGSGPNFSDVRALVTAKQTGSLFGVPTGRKYELTPNGNYQANHTNIKHGGDADLSGRRTKDELVAEAQLKIDDAKAGALHRGERFKQGLDILEGRIKTLNDAVSKAREAHKAAKLAEDTANQQIKDKTDQITLLKQKDIQLFTDLKNALASLLLKKLANQSKSSINKARKKIKELLKLQDDNKLMMKDLLDQVTDLRGKSNDQAKAISDAAAARAEQINIMRDILERLRKFNASAHSKEYNQLLNGIDNGKVMLNGQEFALPSLKGMTDAELAKLGMFKIGGKIDRDKLLKHLNKLNGE